MKLKELSFALISTLAIAATSAGCEAGMTDSDEAPPYIAEQYENVEDLESRIGYELIVPDGQPGTDVIEADGEIAGHPGSICECKTRKCREAWVEESLGCGYCLDVVCEDGSQTGACVICPEDRN